MAISVKCEKTVGGGGGGGERWARTPCAPPWSATKLVNVFQPMPDLNHQLCWSDLETDYGVSCAHYTAVGLTMS